MTDEEIRLSAREFAKKNKKRIAEEMTDSALHAPDLAPISVFMAGSPGAGKTEFSKNLINLLESGKKHQVIRIDGDEIRDSIPGYTGGNANLFQGAISLIVEKIHDRVLEKGQSFILDGTFSHYEKAADNIKRSLVKHRLVIIFYVYQRPDIAWRFTVAREQEEGRHIPKGAFIDQFFAAKEVVDRIRAEFSDNVIVFLVKKDYERNAVDSITEISSSDKEIDDYIQERYTKKELEMSL